MQRDEQSRTSTWEIEQREEEDLFTAGVRATETGLGRSSEEEVGEVEEWRDIQGWEGFYRISSLGRVMSVEREIPTTRGPKTISQRIMVAEPNTRGYLKVNLHRDGRQKTFEIHRMTAKAFLENPQGLPDVDHINRVRSDNRLSNLRWASERVNIINRTPSPNTTTGLVGVRFKSGANRWSARIKLFGEEKYLGTFDTVEKALSARERAVEEMHSTYVRANTSAELSVSLDLF